MRATSVSAHLRLDLGVVDRLGGLCRGARIERRMPRRQLRMLLTPRLRREPEVEIRQRAPDGDMSDREGRVYQRIGLLFERSQGGGALGCEARQMRFGFLGAIALAAPQDQKIEHAVAQRLPPQRREASLWLGRKKLVTT